MDNVQGWVGENNTKSYLLPGKQEAILDFKISKKDPLYDFF